MNSIKDFVNSKSKTSGKKSVTNTALQNTDKKYAVPNKTNKQEKLQPTEEQLRIAKIVDLKPDEGINYKIKEESHSSINKKKKNRARSAKKKDKEAVKGLMMTSRQLTQDIQQKKRVTLPPATTTLNVRPAEKFDYSPFEDNSMRPGKKPTLRFSKSSASKIPLSSVEMPADDSSVNINLLDISFGSFNLSGDAPQLCDPLQEKNPLPPVVKYDDSIAQKLDSVLAKTEYTTISNQASVQTQRSLQVNQAPRPSIKILLRPKVTHSADYLTNQNSAVAANPYQNINTGRPTSMYNSSVYSDSPLQGLSSHTSLYGTTASNIGGNTTNSNIPQLSQSNDTNLNANYPQTAFQPQYLSSSYPNPYSYQASEISYRPIISDDNLASIYTTSTNSNYMYQHLHETGNTNLSKSTVLLSSTTNSTKEGLSEPSNNSWTSSAGNPNGNNISDTTSGIALEQTNESCVLSGMPPSIAPLIDGQYILNQQGIPGYYSQPHSVMYRGEHLQMVQSGLPHYNMTNFYSPNPMYPSVSSSQTGRETDVPGILYAEDYSSLTDSRYTDNSTTPDLSFQSQQMQTLARQHIFLRPPIAPSYIYYYGQLALPANPFQYGTMYLMVPAASATSHGTEATNTMTGYSNTAATPAVYNNIYETVESPSTTGPSNDYGSSISVGMSGQQTTQSQGKTNLSDFAAIYPNKSILKKASTYEIQQQSFPSPSSLSVTNNVEVGGRHNSGSYPPVFNSPMPPGNPQPHNITPLHHQIDMRVQKSKVQELNSATENMSRNQSVNPTANKVKVKQNDSQGANCANRTYLKGGTKKCI